MDIIFNLYKVKFTILDKLLERHCKEVTRNSKVHVYINLEPILKKLLGANIDEYLKVRPKEKVLEFISNIVNLAAHYRWFFNKNRVESKIFLYLSYPFKSIYKNRLLIPEYRRAYEFKFTRELKSLTLMNNMEEVLTLSKIILEYIPGVYLITSEHIEGGMVPHIVNNHLQSDVTNFILTNDRYEYQYTLYDFYAIRAKKENSYIVSRSNLIDRIKLEEKNLSDIEVPSQFYTFMLSILGDKMRNIPKLKGIGMASILKLVNLALEKKIITENTTNINLLMNIVKEQYKAQVLNNFYCTSFEYQYKMLNIKDIDTITDQLVDKFDNLSLKKMNDENFKSYPLNLLEIMPYIKHKPSKDIFVGR